MAQRIKRLKKAGTKHLYAIECRDLQRGSFPPIESIEVEANNRDQAIRIAEANDFEARDCNMIG
jgi:hypothetical protein